MVEGVDVQAALRIAGYRIEAIIGRGGMGTVYRAVQLRLRRDVALKLLSHERASESLFRAQFLEESIRTAGLEHPNIVPVYDAGEADGILYIAMRYIAGRDLQGLIRREGRLSPHAAVGILDQVSAALHTAHEAGLVHRDVKPSNVLIGGDPGTERPLHAWLGDFGLSRRLSDPAEASTERPLGTVAYVAPEQIRGDAVDARADIYSLGCLLHECLTGSVPFDHDTVPAVLYAHLEAPPPGVSHLGLGLPAGMDRVLAWALAKAPDDRPRTATELAQAAGRALSGDAEPIRAAGGGRRAPRAAARMRAAEARRIVGRLRESEDLVGMLDDAIAGSGGVALLSGEAGIGKTTLARELTRLADSRGIAVAWGVGLSAEAARPYWHWSQVVRQIAEGREAEEILAALGSDATWLRALVSTIAPAPAPDSAPGGAPDGAPAAVAPAGEEGRFRIYDALLRLLTIAGRRSGLVVVLDDLHLADEASLLALSYVGRAVGGSRILIVGTHREVELEHSRRGQIPFGELVRATRTIPLRGLPADDVRLMIEARRARAPSDAAVVRIHDQTGGNPLFISQLLGLLDDRLFAETGDRGSAAADMTDVPLPAGVRDAITARVMLLGDGAQEALRVASVIGRRFHAGIVATAAGLPRDALLEHLDAAVRLRLVRALPGSADGYVFEHGLIRATLYGDLPAGRRLALHHRVAVAMEAAASRPGAAALTEIAHHYLQAAPTHDPRRAVEVARRAADGTMAAFAYDQAVGLYRRALEIGVADEAERLALLQSLGDARMRAGDTVGAWETLNEAAGIARGRGDARAFARATLGCGIWGLSFGVDEPLIALAEEAVALLESDPEPSLLARMKVFLATAIYWRDDVTRRERLADEALALAREHHARTGDTESAATLGYVLGRFLVARWGPESAEHDLTRSDEVVELARGLRDGELELLVRNWRITSLLELGRFGAVDAEIARVQQMATELRQPRAMVWLPLHHAIRAASVGRFEEAERLNAESGEIAQTLRGSVGELAGSAQLIIIRLQQGRLPELEGPLRALVAAHPEMVGLRCALAALLVQADRRQQAQAELDELTSRGLDGFPRDCTHILMLGLAAEVAAELRDVARCEALHGWLAPYRGRWVVSAGASALWPVDRVLGRLAAACGREEAALEHLARARSQSERTGALPALALVALDEARVLHARGAPGDARAGLRLTREALDRAGEAGAGMVLDAAVALEVELESGIAAGSAPAAAPDL